MARKIEVGVKLTLKINADDDISLSDIMDELSCATDTDKANIEDVEVIDYECIDSKQFPGVQIFSQVEYERLDNTYYYNITYWNNCCQLWHKKRYQSS